MTTKELDMLQFAVWLLFMNTEETDEKLQYGYSRADWVKLWHKMLERKQ